MKALINGKDVVLTETAVIFYEDILYNDKDGDELDCRMELKCTSEGLIVDLWAVDENGEEHCVATMSALAQELADEYCH